MVPSPKHGRLWSGHPVMIPSTPAGIMEMFHEYGIDLEGKNVVVIGRSNIVGKPMAQLLWPRMQQ